MLDMKTKREIETIGKMLGALEALEDFIADGGDEAAIGRIVDYVNSSAKNVCKILVSSAAEVPASEGEEQKWKLYFWCSLNIGGEYADAWIGVVAKTKKRALALIEHSDQKSISRYHGPCVTHNPSTLRLLRANKKECVWAYGYGWVPFTGGAERWS